MDPQPENRERQPRLEPGPALLLGFVALALVNAVFIAASRAPVSLGVRAAHHFYDAGHLLAAGMLGYGARAAWARFGPRRAAWGYAAASALCLVVGAYLLPDDLFGALADLLGEEPADSAAPVAGALGGLSILAFHLLGQALRRRRPLALCGALVAVALAAANNLLLARDYRGVHALCGLAAATLLGSSITGLALPARAWLARLSRPRVAWSLRAAALVPSVLSLVIIPGPRVRSALTALDGAFIAPLLPWRANAGPRYVTNDPWYQRRDHLPALPPSTPPLVEQPIVILVTMDSVRAELLADPRHAKKLPELKELAAESVVFSEARTPGSGTVVAFSQIFTGKHTFQLRWGREDKRALPKKDPSPRFPELLAADGVQTVTFASFERLQPSFGIAKGFAESELVPPPSGQPYALSEQMMDAALERLTRHDGGRLFLFMHLMDPHYPYDAATTKGSELNRYVAEAGLCSKGIGRLVQGLKERGLWQRTILIVGADHGEGLNKHGIPRHNIGLYEEIARVPLLVRVPGVPGRQVDTPVTLLDLGPTILDLFGLPTPGSFMGQSLVPFLRGESPELTRPIVSSALFNANALYAFPHKIIHDREKGTVEVYDLVDDPDERDNLAEERGDELRGRLETFMSVHAVEKRGK